jgi:hypothetical protein
VTPQTVAAEIAARTLVAVQAAGLKSAHYPAPGQMPSLPTLIVYLGDDQVTYGMGEQYHELTFTGELFTEPGTDVAAAITVIDGLSVLAMDAWDPTGNRQNYLMEGRVDGCAITSARFRVPIFYLDRYHYGTVLTWTASLRRNAGDA